MERVAWNVFVSTGKVEDYLRYRGEDGSPETGKGMVNGENPFAKQVRNRYGRDGYRDRYGIVCDTGGRI